MSNANCKFLRLSVCTLIRVLMRATYSAYPRPFYLLHVPFVITLDSVEQTDFLFSLPVLTTTWTHKPFSVIATGALFPDKATGAWR